MLSWVPSTSGRSSMRAPCSRSPASSAAREEGRPGELEVAHARACELAGLLLAGRLAMDADQELLGDQHAIAQNVLLVELVEAPEDRDERGHVVLGAARDLLELAHVRL